MPIYSTTAAGAQDGYNFGGGPWFDGTPSLLLGVFYHVGLQFPVHTLFDALSRPLDPPLVWPSFNLVLDASTGAWADPPFLVVTYVPEAAPAPYSDTLLPSLRGEQGLGTFGVAGGAYVISGTQLTVTLSSAALVPFMKSSTWNGIISLTVTTLAVLEVHSADSATPALAPRIDTAETPFFTGIDNDGVRLGRPVRDMKTGLPTHVPDLVEDGYRPGVWTSPNQWDPPDPRDERPTEVPDGEGVWDDDIPAH
jgi:hypothetical protein